MLTLSSKLVARAAGLVLLAVCGSAYVYTLCMVVRVLLSMRSEAAMLFGAFVLLGVILNVGVVVLSRRDPERRNFTIPLSVTTLIGSVGHFCLMGMAAVLSGLGGL